jgi:hypothetical protein
MRPQYNRRAQRALATLGVMVLGGGVSGAVASASPTTVPATPVKRHPQARHSRRVHQTRRRVLLHALMLHSEILVGQDIAFIGVTRPGRAHRLIGVQARRGGHWVSVARARTDRRGHFLVRYWPQAPGRVRLRARLAGHGGPGTIVRAPVATVFHAVVASWYGPGGRTACGETLTSTTLGVANRTLPCGTLVTLRYHDRNVRVPVIDRGPFVAGRSYDLTWATKLALGAGDVTVIWASK